MAGLRQRHGLNCKGGRCACPWEAFVYSKRDGKKIRKSFPTRAAAKSWREDTAGAVRKRLMRAPSSTTLREAALAWLADAKAGLVRPRSGEPYKPATIRGYERHLRLHVLPELGARKLSELERADLQDFVDRLVAKDTAPGLIHAAISPVRCVYGRAVERPDSGVVVNPTTGLRLPAANVHRERVAPPGECAQLLTALAAGDRGIWATAMYGGLRRGELMALRVEDIDLQAGVIHVRKGWDQYEGEIDTKGRKTRKVPIPAALRTYLAAHLLALGWREGLAFGISATQPFIPVSLTERADRAWKKAKLQRIALHECRHTFASLMIAAGVNAKALSTYMGHANISITLDLYGHLMPGNEEEAAALLDGYLERSKDAPARASLAPVRSQNDPT